jgi:hypothetical protein
MALHHVIDLIDQDFRDSRVPCLVLYGSDHISEHNDAPRIVVVPTDDNYSPAQYVQQVAFPAGSMADGQIPRTIMTREEGARATIWAAGIPEILPGTSLPDYTTQQRADYDALHALINQFILSLHRVNPGNYKVRSGAITQTTRVDRRGYVYTLEFSVEVPIIDSPWQTEGSVMQGMTVQGVRSDGSVAQSVVIPQ